jgi:hypothetical protein
MKQHFPFYRSGRADNKGFSPLPAAARDVENEHTFDWKRYYVFKGLCILHDGLRDG